MTPEAEARIEKEARQFLSQIALELEAAAAGARKASTSPEQATSWRHMQQLYSRLQEANHLVGTFQKRIDAARAGMPLESVSGLFAALTPKPQG